MNRMLLSVALIIAIGPRGTAQTRGKELPRKYSGPPTSAAISAGDLMTRLYIYADDSMRGRDVTTRDNVRATAYIESEVRRLGLKPAGDNGGYFQDLPIVLRRVDTGSSLTVRGRTFRVGQDFVVQSNGRARTQEYSDVIYGGTALDTVGILPVSAVRGKTVVIRPFVSSPGFSFQKLETTAAFKEYSATMYAAAGVITLVDSIPERSRQLAFHPTSVTVARDYDLRLSVAITPKVLEVAFGLPESRLTKGAIGKTISVTLAFRDEPRPAGRNVAAIVPGSDPKLSGEYVAIGAHSDHIGMSAIPQDHDSIKVFNMFARPQGADQEARTLNDEEWRQVNRMIDSLRILHGGPRPDSTFNGADDDGSGTVSLLEIAEALVTGKIKTKRSILLIWHAGEERGLWGSDFFVNHPSVPRDSIVAQINIDMIGRGAPADVTGLTKDGVPLHGAERYVQVVGSRRLSSELGELVEAVNKAPDYNFSIDYALDADGHPQNIYCRSDHASYAAWGVPVVFFTTGGHADYHQVTDEPQYIRYDHMARLARMILDVATHVANLDHRLLVDGHKALNPHGPCQQ